MNDIVAKDLPVPTLAKQEMDRSYEKEVESGFQSSFSSATKTDSEDSWVMIKGETVDPLAFDPPIQSSNLSENMFCNISTISGDGQQFKGLNYLHINV